MTLALQFANVGPALELRPRGSHTRSKKNKGKRPQQGG